MYTKCWGHNKECVICSYWSACHAAYLYGAVVLQQSTCFAGPRCNPWSFQEKNLPKTRGSADQCSHYWTLWSKWSDTMNPWGCTRLLHVWAAELMKMELMPKKQRHLCGHVASMTNYQSVQNTVTVPPKLYIFIYLHLLSFKLLGWSWASNENSLYVAVF